MPLRSKLLTKRWSTVELPIPPFLAPQVFTPWPSFGRRTHTGAQTAQKYDTNEQNHDIKLSKCDEDDQVLREQDFTVLRLAGKVPGRPKRPAGKAVDEALKPSSAWANISDIYGASGNSAEESKKASTEPSSNGLFHKKYEDIWGVGKMDPSQGFYVKAERNWTKEKVHASDSGQSLRRVRLQVETIVNDTDKANFHEGHNAVEYHTGAEVKATQFRHVEAVESLQQEPPTEGKTGHHNIFPTTLIPQFRTTRKKAFRRPIQLNNRKTLQCGQAGQLTEQNLTHRKASPATSGSQRKATRTTVFLCKRLRLRASTKYVRWSPGHPHGGFNFWQTRFADLSLRLNGVPERIAFTNQMSEPRIHESLIESDSSVSLRKAWEALSAQRRGDAWPELMLLALEEYPTKVLKLLVATYIEPYPPQYAISDCFDYIISYYLSNRNVKNSKNALEIFTAFEHMLRVGPPGHIHVSQKSVHLLLKHLADVYVGKLFQVLTEFDHPLSKYTLMHFPSKMRLFKGHDERIDVLKRLWEAGSDFNSPEVSSVCVTLLQKKNRSSEVSYSDSEIFEFMLECGMKPNIIIYNVLLQNSLESGDPETAWQIHDMMVKNGIETDGYTYSLLLTDAKLRGDRPSIQRILKLVGDRGVQNAHVATDILHTIYLFRRNYEVSPHWEEKGRPAKVFQRMLTVYRQYFRLEPLTHIIPWLGTMYPNCANSVRTSSELTTSSDDTLMDPNIPTLVVMLTALLRECTEPVLVLHFYNHFRDLVKGGDVTATALAKSTHVYNIILMALGRFAETLALCPRLIGDMLSQNAGRTSVNGSLQSIVETEPPSENAPAAQQKLHPKPDVYTWSILLKIFMDHIQPRAAEKVLAMMEERKVWPNQITWNSLIIGYARMQDMSMTVDAVDRLKKSGFDIDGVTMKGLSYFQNRRALIEAMRASEVRNSGRSISKRPRGIGMAFSALTKTMKMVDAGVEGDGLQCQVEAVDEHHVVAPSAVQEEEGEFFIRDILREEDNKVDLEG